MKTLLNHDGIRRAIELAESATAGMSDAELRGIAFGKVLDRLLEESTVAFETKPSSTEGKRGIRLAPRSTAPVDGPKTWIESLVSEEFFDSPKSLAEVTEAVRARGHNIESKNVTDPLEKAVVAKILRRERKPGDESKRGIWRYSIY